ncbi:Wadjet anti-phage system protein JetD domain-containing protein [Bacillus pumilus]|uniref:Wadjet anti-phage system protein JetD domain-containing protein n=1 Tax=Bacillus pumilus TaxID=1408 RepID=UPI0011A66DDA|nr:Wadjet anti-phage system protein JetD domain-containing protein [Bacillus pumilus]
MRYASYALQELVNKYNSSKLRKGEAKINRKIKLPFTPENMPSYFIDGLQNKRDIINNEMIHLEKLDLIEINWIELNYLIKDIIINIRKIEDVHEFLGIKTLSDIINDRLHQINSLEKIVSIGWIKRAIKEMKNKLYEKELPSLLKNDFEFTLLMKTFIGIENKADEILPERLFSKRFLGNSKLFENSVRSKLITQYKKFGIESSFLTTDFEADDLLQEIGIVKSVEEIQVWGDLQYGLNERVMDFKDFCYGTTLNSDTIRNGDIVSIESTQMLIVENKTVFREYIKNKNVMNELVIYVGGFPGPDKKRFFRQVFDWVNNNRIANFKFFFWGDIDLGGFRIFSHLKLTIPDLVPFQMDSETFLKYIDYAEKAEEGYLKKVEKLLLKEHFSEFHPVIKLIIKTKKRLEQEALLL